MRVMRYNVCTVGTAKFAYYVVGTCNFKVNFKLFSTDSCPKEIKSTSVVIIGMYIYVYINWLQK